jgi:hypothetical protein
MSRTNFGFQVRKLVGLSVSLGILFSSSMAFAQTVVPTDPDESNGNTGGDTTLPIADVTRFSCQQSPEGQPTVMYQPDSQPDQLYAWATPRQLGGGWTPQRRCEEIARRLELYRGDGLRELRTGRENGMDTVCATTDDNPACRIVFTVPPGQDAFVTRNQVFENLLTADSGQNTLPVYTFTSRGGGLLNLTPSLSRKKPSASTIRTNKASIRLKPFLSPNDGGTLRPRSNTTKPSTTPRNPRLPNIQLPRIFR